MESPASQAETRVRTLREHQNPLGTWLSPRVSDPVSGSEFLTQWLWGAFRTHFPVLLSLVTWSVLSTRMAPPERAAVPPPGVSLSGPAEVPWCPPEPRLSLLGPCHLPSYYPPSQGLPSMEPCPISDLSFVEHEAPHTPLGVNLGRWPGALQPSYPTSLNLFPCPKMTRLV